VPQRAWQDQITHVLWRRYELQVKLTDTRTRLPGIMTVTLSPYRLRAWIIHAIIWPQILWLVPATAQPGQGEPLDLIRGRVYRVNGMVALQQALDTANRLREPATLLLAEGTYRLDIPLLEVTCPGLVIRSEKGIRDRVILRGPDEGPQATVAHIFLISANDVVIADMTFGWCRTHGIQVRGESPADVSGLHVHNCHIVNCNEQFIKGSSHSDDPEGATDGRIENCHFEFTGGWAYQHYTGGIDIHKGINWIVRDNLFYGIRNPSDQPGIAEHAVHFWKRCPTRSQNIVVARNWIINCDRGIGFGLVNLPGGHQGGQSCIRNNMIYNDGTGDHTDVGIGLEFADHVTIQNNTVLIETYWAPVEYRFAGSTNLVFQNNLVNRPIQRRDNAPPAILSHNLEQVEPAWFHDRARGDLHLTASARPAIDTAQALTGFTDDLDGQSRPMGRGWDIGADELTYPTGKK